MEYNNFQNKELLKRVKKLYKWNLYKLEEVITDDTRNAVKYKKSEYGEEGKYPIIDQGQNHIAGYTDSSKGLYKTKEVIVFGDHTRILKFLDLEFFLGADGAKILRNKKENVNMKYMYFFLKSVHLPNDGYSRHYKYLKEVIVPLPQLETQKKIAQVLDKAQLLIDKRKEQINACDELVKSLFYDMFGDPVVNSKGWDEIKLNQIVKGLIAGKSLASDDESEYKVLKTSSISYEKFDPTKVKNLPSGYKPPVKHFLKKGDILISRMNTSELVGAVATVDKDYEYITLPDRIWKVSWKYEVQSKFIWCFLNLNFFREKVSRNSTGTSGSMKNISQKKYLSLPILLPPIQLQNQFAEKVEQIEKHKKKLQESLVELENNFNSLMQKAFKGELF